MAKGGEAAAQTSLGKTIADECMVNERLARSAARLWRCRRSHGPDRIPADAGDLPRATALRRGT